MDEGFFLQTIARLLAGVPMTLQLAGISLAAGFMLALLLLGMRFSGFRSMAALSSAYVFVFRGIPLLVLLYLVYYAPAQFPGVRSSVLWPFLRDPYWCALLALTLVTAAYASEIIRGGILSIPKGILEASSSLGLKRHQRLAIVVMPLAIRNAIPAYGNEILIMVKATSLVSVITLMDITGIAYRIASETYRVTPVFIAAGALYLILNALLASLVTELENRMHPER